VRHAEVRELREARPRRGLGNDHHVLRLHVPVDDPARVRVLERLAQSGADPRDVAVGDRASLRELRERSAPNELGDEVHVLFVGGQLVDRDDAGMVEPGGCARLALDPLPGAVLARNRLHCDLALQLFVPREPDDAEAARPQTTLHPVAVQDQPSPGGVRQSLCRVRTHPSLVFGFRGARPAPRSYCPRPAHDAPTALGAIRLSFLDEPDEPARPTRRRTPRGPSTDRQTLMVRRTIAIGGGLLLFVLLVFGVRGCLDARKERAMEDYVRGANELVDLSKAESRQLFDVLGAGTGQDQAVDQQNQANALRVDSATLSDRARDLDVPDELSEAHDYFLEALDLRRDGLAEIASELPGALAQEERRESTAQIANVMRVFLASDVLLVSRFKPILDDALKAEEVTVPTKRPPALTFVEDISWVDPDFVADEIEGIRAADGTETAGLHGNGLGAVSLAGTALTPGGSATVALTQDAAFDVEVVNQGDSTETDVRVSVTVGSGGDAIEAEETIDEIAAGEAKAVTIPLSRQPPTGQNVPITVRVEPVQGEEVTDNNEGEFTVIFTR
jgi:hypothetical protein